MIRNRGASWARPMVAWLPLMVSFPLMAGSPVPAGTSRNLQVSGSAWVLIPISMIHIARQLLSIDHLSQSAVQVAGFLGREILLRSKHTRVLATTHSPTANHNWAHVNSRAEAPG